MIRNFLLIAFRNFQRQRLFALLNMFGLAVGLSSAILIFLYVSDELRYDSMHPYYDDTYRVACTWSDTDGRVFENEVAPGFWVKQLKDTRSEVLQAIRIDYIGYPTSLHDKNTDKIILTESIKWAEPHFDDIFDFKLIKGNQDKMLDDHNTIVVSESGAQKLFGNIEPMGQIITVKHRWATLDREIDVVVTGVYRDLPANSHFKPLFILNVNALRPIHSNFDIYMEGTSFSRDHQIEFFESYLVLKPGADTKEIQVALDGMADHLTRSDSSSLAQGWKLTPTMTPLKDLHFDQKIIWEYGFQGDKKYLAIFSAVAILILIIACINYMNLATARSARRAKEVGLRKSLGSDRGQIAKQFFYESFLMTLGSLVIGFILVVIFLQPFNQLAHKSFSIASLFDPFMIGIVALVALFMAFISGSYPAIYMSGFISQSKY